MYCIEQSSRLWHPSGSPMSPKERPDAPDPDATLPAEERGTGSLDNPNDTARWLALADTALSRGASDDAVAETERLARKEQAAIKRRIRRTAEKVKSHSKSKQ